MSSRLPSAPESSSAVPSCRSAAHCKLTGRRVVDEALLRDTPPDSSLRPTVGPDLLRDSSPGNGQPRRSIGTAPSSSDDLSPPWRAELYPPAWVRQPTSDRPRGNSTTSISCWIRSASPCRNMSHCAFSFHSHSGIVRNGLLPLAEVGQHARCLAPDQRAIEHPPHLLRE